MCNSKRAEVEGVVYLKIGKMASFFDTPLLIRSGILVHLNSAMRICWSANPFLSSRWMGIPCNIGARLILSLIKVESLLKRKGKHLSGCMQFALRASASAEYDKGVRSCWRTRRGAHRCWRGWCITSAQQSTLKSYPRLNGVRTARWCSFSLSPLHHAPPAAV